MKIAFRSNQLCERGTEVAMYDYAIGNREFLGNESIIISQNSDNPSNLLSLPKFQEQFDVFLYDNGNNDQMDKILKDNKVDAMYNICHGMYEGNLSKVVPNLIHCVFECSKDLRVNSDDRQAAICEYLSLKYTDGKMPWIPHIIEIKDPTNKDLREELEIPEDARVIGRHGGTMTFNLSFVHDAIYAMAHEFPDTYWLFMNTDQFCPDMDNIIHLPATTSEREKAEFINTCDAMIHAREEGEIFSVGLGEFSIRNKPIFTYSNPMDTGHFFVFGDKLIKYSDAYDLYDILCDGFDFQKAKNEDWDAYKDIYCTANIMRKFKEVFLD